MKVKLLVEFQQNLRKYVFQKKKKREEDCALIFGLKVQNQTK